MTGSPVGRRLLTQGLTSLVLLAVTGCTEPAQTATETSSSESQLGSSESTESIQTGSHTSSSDTQRATQSSGASPVSLVLNTRMARDEPASVHPDLLPHLGLIVSAGNSSQEAFFDLANVPAIAEESPRIRHWSEERIEGWSQLLVEHDIALAASVNMYEPVAAQIEGWKRFEERGVRVEHFLIGSEFYLRQWFEGNPGNGMLGQIRYDDELDEDYPAGPGVRYYADLLHEYLPAFRDAFPEAKLYIIACTVREGGGLTQQYRRIWRDKVIAFAEDNPSLVDGFRFHIYVGDYVSDVEALEENTNLDTIAEQAELFPLPLFVAEGGRRDAIWNAEGETRLAEYVVTVAEVIQARRDGSIQGHHVAYHEWSSPRHPLGHPHPLATLAGIMYDYDPERFDEGSAEVVLTPKGEWFVEHWRDAMDEVAAKLAEGQTGRD
ncbi:MAG: hypothetical protein EA397_05435 [Deltaproteobacteria bacterium]|nr:MAG: hypothetical protein EA397_05435 [Deltaproteobacteria bacterium]